MTDELRDNNSERDVLIFWQNIPSIHQAAFIREIAKKWDGAVFVVAESDVSSHRLQQGWSRPSYAPAKLLILPTIEKRYRFLSQINIDRSVNIFSGFHAYPVTYRTLKYISRTKSTIGVFVEPGRTDDGIKGFLRKLRYRYHRIRWAHKLKFLLATGANGECWYQQCGFPKAKIFPFGYFVDTQSSAKNDDVVRTFAGNKNSVRLLFVGELAEWKGLDLLLNALSSEVKKSWHLHVVGDGALINDYKSMAVDLGLRDRVTWQKALPNKHVRILMESMDVVVLPSRYDGWVAVVNEAMLAGTPVIVSAACGASDLVQESFLGAVIKSDSVVELRAALSIFIDKGKVSVSEREIVLSWAKAAITPHAGASYLLEIIRCVRFDRKSPPAPWRVKRLQSVICQRKKNTF